jgi:hypothetical protein
VRVKEADMSEEKLFTDLAIAERNSKRNATKKKIQFSLAVREAFIRNRVDTFIDLVAADRISAVQLHKMAVESQLI